VPAKKKKSYYTRFWRITYQNAEGTTLTRLAQGPKHYRVAKVKKDLKLACPEMQVLSIKRVPRPEWSVIFEITEESHV